MYDVNDAFNRTKGGTKSTCSIEKIASPKVDSEERKLFSLATKLNRNAVAWRCKGLLADGIISVDDNYYLVELKTSMYWGSFTSALVQLFVGRSLVMKFINNPKNKDIIKDLNIDKKKIKNMKMLIVFTKFSAWTKTSNLNNPSGWGQLCKHLEEVPASWKHDVGFIGVELNNNHDVKKVHFPPFS
jgi:hypothetical protein